MHGKSPAAHKARKPPPLDLLRGASLFLDFDGTLVELADDPQAIVVGDRLQATLHRLGAALAGRLAIVSGRSVSQIRGFLGDRTPSVSGSHGAELHWASGHREQPERPEWLDAATARMHAFSQDQAGVLVEVKPFGVALHYRQAPDAEAACHALAGSLATRDDIHVQKGKMMVELRASGADKGDALRAFMATPPMAGTVPLMFGDDLTDESAFAAAAALGGAGILVGEERESAAGYRLAGVGPTLDWLDQAVAGLA